MTGHPTVRTPCHMPMSFLQSRTFTSVSPKREMTKHLMQISQLQVFQKGFWDTRYESRCDLHKHQFLTFAVVTGLRQGLTVSQHGDLRHSNSHHCPLLTGFVLETEKHRIHAFQQSYNVKILINYFKAFEPTSMYAVSVLAVGMWGCQSLDGLVRYLVSVTTHFILGHPGKHQHHKHAKRYQLIKTKAISSLAWLHWHDSPWIFSERPQTETG